MATSSGVDHCGYECLDDVDRAHQVDLDHAAPVPVLECGDGAPRGDAGDVHHDVDRAVSVVDLLRERHDGVDIGDVERLRVRDVAASSLDRRDGLVERGDVGQHNPCAALGGDLGGRAADAAGCAGD